MKVFKYLVALADISVGFLGLFFVIFAVTRPTLTGAVAEKAQLEKTLRQLQEEIRRLEEIKLAPATAGRKLAKGQSASILVALEAVTVESAGRSTRFPNIAAFAAAPLHKIFGATGRWPDNIVLYIDHRVPFERVVAVIDALKSANNAITVQIAARAK